MQPPITIDGPKTPPDPPELIVIDVVRILSNANDIKREIPRALGFVSAVCRTPYPVPSTARKRGSPLRDQYKTKHLGFMTQPVTAFG